jgi:hypothetical protein
MISVKYRFPVISGGGGGGGARSGGGGGGSHFQCIQPGIYYKPVRTVKANRVCIMLRINTVYLFGTLKSGDTVNISSLIDLCWNFYTIYGG